MFLIAFLLPSCTSADVASDDMRLNLRLARSRVQQISTTHGYERYVHVTEARKHYHEVLTLGTPAHPTPTEALTEYADLLEDLELNAQTSPSSPSSSSSSSSTSPQNEMLKYTSLDLITEAALRGNPEAQLNLASALATGIHTGI